MQTVHRIEDEYDALVIGCFGDPGIRALRELLEIPVIGPAEVTIHSAAMVADRFTWLTILDETIPMSHEQSTNTTSRTGVFASGQWRRPSRRSTTATTTWSSE